jgi:hypothetical protein
MAASPFDAIGAWEIRTSRRLQLQRMPPPREHYYWAPQIDVRIRSWFKTSVTITRELVSALRMFVCMKASSHAYRT